MNIVIFTGGLYPSPAKADGFLRNLGSVDCVIAADSGLDALLVYKEYFAGSFDFTPSHITGDFDSVSDRALVDSFPSAQKHVFPHDKDFTDTELALKLACSLSKDRRKDRIVLIGGDGGRMDHLLGVVNTFSSDFHSDFWLGNENLICFVGQDSSLEIKDAALEDRISVINPCPQNKCIVKTSGLEWSGELFAPSFIMSISNRISREYFQKKRNILISTKVGCCLVILPIKTIIIKGVGL